MKQERRITYQAGITRTPSDFLSKDGELAECINLVTDHEELKPMVPMKLHKTVYRTAQNNQVEEYRLVYVFRSGGNVLYILMRTSTSLLYYWDASEFFDFKAPAPDVEADDGWLLEYEAPCLKSVLSRCNFAMAQDELRPVMNGVYVNLTDQFSDYVSSDGHKLVRVRKDPVYSGSSVVSTSFILPSAVVKTLLKVTPSTGDIDLEYQKELIKEHTRTDKDGNGRTVKEKYPVTERRPQCRIVIDDTLTISFNPIEGKYPKYWSVIPETHVFKMTVDRKALIKSCDRLSIFANQSDLVEMRIDESTLKLKSENADFEVAADEQLPCVSEPFDGHSPINLRIGMNAVSVSQTLKTIFTEKAVFLLYDYSRAAIIQPQPQPDNEEITMLLMPMLIND